MTIGPDPTMRIDSMSVRRGTLSPPFVQPALHRSCVELPAFGWGDEPHRKREPVHAFERRNDRPKLLGLAQGLAALLFRPDARFCGEFLLQGERAVEFVLQRRAGLRGE